jgi:hypothetical protein
LSNLRNCILFDHVICEDDFFFFSQKHCCSFFFSTRNIVVYFFLTRNIVIYFSIHEKSCEILNFFFFKTEISWGKPNWHFLTMYLVNLEIILFKIFGLKMPWCFSGTLSRKHRITLWYFQDTFIKIVQKRTPNIGL